MWTTVSKTLSGRDQRGGDWNESPDAGTPSAPVGGLPVPKLLAPTVDTSKSNQVRNGVIPDITAGRLLKELSEITKDVCELKSPTSTSLDTPEMVALTAFYEKSCTFEKVFGCSGLEMPPVSDTSEMNDKQCDYLATSMLTPELRKTYVAYWVRDDGNCFWRAITMGLWGSDEYWAQVKLVVLAWAAARGQCLLDDDDAIIYVSNDIYNKHSVFDGKGNRTGDDGSFYKMLLESIVVFCSPGEWGGDMTALMVSHALGIKVKVVVPTDMDARRSRNADKNASPLGTGRNGSNMEDDCRQSRSFSPGGPPRAWRMPAMGGNGFVDREEVVIAMTTGSKEAVLESELTGLSEVHESTTRSRLCHFAAIMNKTGGTWPFPLHQAAPALFKTHDDRLRQEAVTEHANWEKRQKARAEAEVVATVAVATAAAAAEVEATAAAAATATMAAATTAAAAVAAAKAEQEKGNVTNESLEAATAAAEEATVPTAAAAATTVPTAAETATTVAVAANAKHDKQDAAKEALEAAAEAAAIAQEPGTEGGSTGAHDDICSMTLYSILPNACRGKERRVKGCAKKVEVKRAIAKNAKSRHKKLKTAYTDADKRRREDVHDSRIEWVASTACWDLAKGRRKAAKARRKYDSANRALKRALCQLHKKCQKAAGKNNPTSFDSSGDQHGDEGDESEDSHSSGETRGWNSGDDLSSDEDEGNGNDEAAAAANKEEGKTGPGAAAGLEATPDQICAMEREVEDCAKKVERDKLAAKRAKSKHKKLKMAAADAKNQALDNGANTRLDEQTYRARIVAAAARREYDRVVRVWKNAQRALKKMRAPGGQSSGPMSDSREDNGSSCERSCGSNPSGSAGGWLSNDDLSSVEESEEDSHVVLKEGFVFLQQGNDDEETWEIVLQAIRAALARAGHTGKTWTKSVRRIDGPSRRYSRKEIKCSGSGKTPASTNPKGPQRKGWSAKCDCRFQVCVSWTKTNPPTITKVCTTHAKECQAQRLADQVQRENEIDPKTLQEKWEDDIRTWTRARVRVHEMFRLIEDQIGPLKLGPTGRRKVRNISDRMTRGNWATGPDAPSLTPKLPGDNTCESDSETDSCRRLQPGMRSTKDPQAMARRFDGVVVQDTTCLTNRVGPTRTSLETEHVDANILQVAEPFFKELNVHKASKYAEEAMRAEVSASLAYSTAPLTEGVGAGQYLMDLATQPDDGRPKDVCCEVPEEALHSDAGEEVDISTFGTTSLLRFAKFVENVQVNTVVKVLYTWKKPHVGHIVVLGPNNFQLCTCLQMLRTGLPCRHVLAVLMNLECTAEFSGASLHPRWRRSSEEWSIASAGLRAFDGDGLGPRLDGFTDDLQGMKFGDCHDGIAPKVAQSSLRGKLFADMSETLTRSCKILVDRVETKDSSIFRRGQELVDRFYRDVIALVEAGDGSSDLSLNTAGIPDPSIRPSKNRGESRMKDCLEGGPNKKRKC